MMNAEAMLMAGRTREPVLDPRQTVALNRVGDVMIPGDGEFPRFSTLNCMSQFARISDHMPEADLKDLKLLLSILSYFPKFLIAALFHFLELAPRVPGPLGGPLRLIRIGMRGLVMTLYYGDPRVLKIVGYDVGVYTDDR